MEEIRIEEQRSEENTVNEQPEKKGSVGFLFDLVSIIATSRSPLRSYSCLCSGLSALSAGR